MRIGRISFDIFGLIAFGEFTIKTHVIRAGKTIELIEAELQHKVKLVLWLGHGACVLKTVPRLRG